jgi:biopolymer transport protein ExbD
VISQIPEFAALIPQSASQAAPQQAATPSAVTQTAPTQYSPPRPSPMKPQVQAAAAPAATGRAAVQSPHSAATAVDHASLNGDEFGIVEPAKARRRRPRKRLEESVMDMTPMIDVTFQLLIFFMLSNQLANPNPMEVPEAVYGQGITPDGKQALLVDDQGRYYFGEVNDERNVAPSLDALVRAVDDYASQQNQALDVIISAHKNAKHRHLRELVEGLEKLNNIGVIRVGVEEKQ